MLDESSSSERRGLDRSLVCLTADVEHPGDASQVALIRDLSPSGAFLLTRLTVEVGERFELRIHFPGARVAEVGAQVVRIEDLSVARADLWTSGVAVQFDQPLRGFEAEIERYAAQARESGLTR